MEFEWDDNRDRANIAKHGIGFARAARIVDGPTRKLSRVLPASRWPRNRNAQRDTFHRHDAGNQYSLNIPHKRENVKPKSKKKAQNRRYRGDSELFMSCVQMEC